MNPRILDFSSQIKLEKNHHLIIMLSDRERNLIYDQAYMPEHLPDYVEAISTAEAHLHDDCLCYSKRKHLIFVGYPLSNIRGDIAGAYESACERFNPTTVSVIAPRLWFEGKACGSEGGDNYYRLELPIKTIDPEVSYMMRRAARELKIGEGTFGREHKRLIRAFIKHHDITPEHEKIFKRIHHYLKRPGHTRLLEARKDNNTLSAFTVVDLGSAGYAFYLFNFRSPEESIPGVSDLLFHEMACLSHSEGKAAINLGLGINSGNRRFKEKWGGTIFVSYTSTMVNRQQLNMDTLLNKL